MDDDSGLNRKQPKNSKEEATWNIGLVIRWTGTSPSPEQGPGAPLSTDVVSSMPEAVATRR